MRALLALLPVLMLITHVVVYRIGSAVGGRKALKRYKDQALCACNHPSSFHVNGNGACRHADYNAYVSKLIECTCQKYSGPEPLPSFYAPEIE